MLDIILSPQYQIKTATNAREALQILRDNNSIDLVLLDILMPGIDGYEVCRQIKANPDTRDIPIIFISALHDVETRVKGFAVGGVDFISKPVHFSEVLARVATHIKIRKMQQQLKQARDCLECRVKQRTHDLEQSEARYRSLLEASPDGVMLVGEDGKIELINKEVSNLFGYSYYELVGQPVEILIPRHFKHHESCRSGFMKNPQRREIKSHGKSNNSSQNLLMGLRKDGTEFPVEISLNPVVKDHGSVVIVGIRDITERVRLEQQLNQASKMDALGQLTGGIAHDFNNILCSVIAYAELAKGLGPGAGEKLEMYLDRIIQAGERAGDLVSQMMLFSRRGGARQLQPLKLTPLLDESVKLLRPILPSTLKIQLQPEDDLPDVLIDPAQINQLVINLCINARDAMAEHGVIKIRSRKINFSDNSNIVCSSCLETIHGAYVEVLVSDTGSGIDANNLTKIFEPFFTTKDVGKGTGMGLSMVHGIMHSYGGHVVVETSLGHGSCFRLLFPVADSPVVEVAEDENMAVDVSANGESILVVDDEEAIGFFLEELLSEAGYKVTRFTDSGQALEFFNNHSDELDLVIADQTMPDMSGVELAQNVLAERDDLPIILISGYSSVVDEEKATAMGLGALFCKPINTKKLLQKINSLLSKQACI